MSTRVNFVSSRLAIVAVVGCLALAAFAPSPVLAADLVHVSVASYRHGALILVKSGGTCEHSNSVLPAGAGTRIACEWNKGTGTIAVSDVHSKKPICEGTFDRDDRKSFHSADNSC